MMKIYPTPPTPMQQFSPQGALVLNSHLVAEIHVTQQQCHAGGTSHTSSSDVPCKKRLTLEEFSNGPSLIADMFNEASEREDEEVFNGEPEIKFPEPDSFAGDLFDEAVELSARLKQLSSQAGEQRSKIKSTLKARAKRCKLNRKVSSYQKNLAERMRLPTREHMIANQLERSEMAFRAMLRSVTQQQLISGRGGMVNPAQVQRSNSIRQQLAQQHQAQHLAMLQQQALRNIRSPGQPLMSPNALQQQPSPHQGGLPQASQLSSNFGSPQAVTGRMTQRGAPLDYQLSSISSASTTSVNSVPATGELASGKMFSALNMPTGGLSLGNIISPLILHTLLRDTVLDVSRVSHLSYGRND